MAAPYSEASLHQLLDGWRLRGGERAEGGIQFVLSPDQRAALIDSDLVTEDERAQLRAEADEIRPSAAGAPMPPTQIEQDYLAGKVKLAGDEASDE